jgi:beta-phosphoglucomutase-like phosphatase (HAD superfamily)
MLSSSDKNKLVDKVNTAFTNIGKSNGTKMPPSTSNTDSYAYDYWVAQQLASLANKRKEQAEKAAVKAGVLLDKEKNPQPEGNKQVVYHGDNVAISLAVSNAAERVNVDKFIEALAEAGISDHVVMAAKDKATSKSRPAHVFTTYLLTNDD